MHSPRVFLVSAHWYFYEDPRETAAACCQKILEVLKETLADRDRAALAVSGGTTPKLLFADMAKSRFDWSRTHLFWVDERGVPPTDAQSNYKLAKENFIDPAGFPAQNVHRIQAELDPQRAAQLYADEIRSFFSLGPGEFPSFDIIHQGMGPDAHTASLFPGEPLIDDRENLVAATYVEKMQQWRITLLPGLLLAARNTIMLVAGDDKAEPLDAVLTEPYNPQKYPAQIMTRSRGNVLWFVDKAAAREIR
jgi:6-phosphogluconolactonase